MTARPKVRSLPLVVVALALTGFTSVLVGTVTSMALGELAEVFQVPLGATVWVTTSFLLTAGLALPVAGWAVDRFGGRSVLLVGICIFVAGALGSGLADELPQLIASRAVQGLGGGALEPAALALLAQIVDRRRLGSAMGVMATLINIAPVVGPLLGAVLLGAVGWRWIFLFAVPPVLLAAVLFTFSMTRDQSAPTAQTTPKPPLDLGGLAMIAGGFSAALMAITSAAAGSVGPALVCGVVAAVLLRGYAVRALRPTARPVVDLRLLADTRLASATAIMALESIALFSVLTMVPMLGSHVWGLSELAQGFALSAFALGMLASMSFAGFGSDRVGTRPIVTGGACLAALAFAALALTLLTGGPGAVGIAALALAGVGLGAVSVPTFSAVYRLLPNDVIGSGSTAVLMAAPTTP